MSSFLSADGFPALLPDVAAVRLKEPHHFTPVI
jgi:hypothetical protein